MSDTSRLPRHQLRQPRIADMVAEELRDRILAGHLPDGALLPKQEQLFDEFRVSLPSIREALRILETEGLITVLRGNTGGAEVRHPTALNAAYMLALVLQSRGVGMEDIARAMQHLEATCAVLAATREDRATTVVPQLRARLDESEAVIDDGEKYVSLARKFHEDLVESCGNETLLLMVGALETLWSAHVEKLVTQSAQLGEFGDVAVRRRSLHEHNQLIEAIERGDPREAEALAREHFSRPQRLPFVASGTVVKASLLRS